MQQIYDLPGVDQAGLDAGEDDTNEDKDVSSASEYSADETRAWIEVPHTSASVLDLLSEDLRNAGVDALRDLWTEADSLDSHCRDADARAYTELCLVVAEILDSRDGHQIRSQQIWDNLSPFTYSELEGRGGPTGCTTSELTLSRTSGLTKTTNTDGETTFYHQHATIYETEVLTDQAFGLCREHLSGGPADWAEAIDLLCEDHCPKKISELFTTEPTHTPGQEGRTGSQDGQAGQGRPTEAEATAIVSVSDAVRGDGEVSVESVSAAGKREFEELNLVPQVVTGCEWSVTGCELSGGEPANRFRLRMLPDSKIRALLERSPRGDYPRNAVPTDLYESSVEWRPVLDEAEPLAAIYQYNLMAFWREEEYNFEDDCTNIPLPYDKIFGAFGLTEDMAYQRGLNSGMLLELYRAMVDPMLDWTGWHPKEGKARVIKRHGIPQSIVEQRKAMLGPGEIDNRKELITGKVASNRDWSAPVNNARQEEIDEQEPIIEPPAATKRIQEYLNGLDLQYFSHGLHGNLRDEMIDQAIFEVASSIPEEQRRDQERVKLHWMRHFPQPLYSFCDRFPRLKADYYNQAMNLPSRVLRAMYTENDYELDLSKAHLGSYVPVAQREDLEVPTLCKYLQANLDGDESLLKGGDLWTDLASTMELGDATAARSAAKRVYSSVYGSSKQNLLYQIYKEYAKLTGTYLDSFEPLQPILSHPLMEELLETRDKLEAIITNRGGLEDANGRFIPLEPWDEVKDKENRWRGVMAYVNASYEQELVGAAFDTARKEKRSEGRTDFKIWLYQADGFTVRMRSRVSKPKRIARLKQSVAQKAEGIGVPIELEVDWPE